jgi:hypothetical protein
LVTLLDDAATFTTLPMLMRLEASPLGTEASFSGMLHAHRVVTSDDGGGLESPGTVARIQHEA